MKITLEEARDFLRDRYPLLAEITDELEASGGLRLVRFSQGKRKGRVTGTLKLGGSLDDYVLAFALQPSEVMLFRCDGRGVLPVQLDELTSEAVLKAISDDTSR